MIAAATPLRSALYMSCAGALFCRIDVAAINGYCRHIKTLLLFLLLLSLITVHILVLAEIF